MLPDGTRNAMHLQRLKDKLGNHSNASSEVEYHGAWARMVGEPGRGVPTIIEMVGHTRLDCTLGGAAGMRWAAAQAIHHASFRSAFGAKLIDQPLMRNVLADLALEAEAATALAMRLARAYDEAHADAGAGADDTDAQLFKRLATAVGKYWVCKRVPQHAFEALECFGGSGYVEESGMPRLYREAPLASIWEGSGNVMSLDVLRALSRSPRSLEVFLDEVALARGANADLDAARWRLACRAGAARGPRGPGSAGGRVDGARPAGLAARPVCAGGGVRRVLRRAARGAGGTRVRDAAGRQRLRAIIERARIPVWGAERVGRARAPCPRRGTGGSDAAARPLRTAPQHALTRGRLG